MQPSRLAAALEKAAGRLGIEVRYEIIGRTSTSDPGGGLCRVRGKPVVVVDSRLGATDRAATLARALAAFGVFDRPWPPGSRMPDEVRAAIAVQAARMKDELATALGRRQSTRSKFRRGLHPVYDGAAPVFRAQQRAPEPRPAGGGPLPRSVTPSGTANGPKLPLRPLARVRPRS